MLACANNKQVIVYETGGWTAQATLTDAKLKGVFTVCAFSNCGKFIAAGTSKGELLVWTASDGKRINGSAEGESDEAITSLNWNPNGLLQFVYADKSGQIGCVNVDSGLTNGKANRAGDKVGQENRNGKRIVIILVAILFFS